ncbi:MAG: hypothetical protein D6729_13995 [Deltaproteobacteria bacterium]|nr:MAG: hypothetical protein D6729_13995 [Deltaproteobacteria bacterium]
MPASPAPPATGAGAGAARRGAAGPPETGEEASRCLWAEPVEGRPTEVELILERIRWQGWSEACARLVAYLRPGPPPYDAETVEASERLLKATGYFAAAHCSVSPGGTRLVCRLRPARMVRTVEIGGQIPFTVLEDDLQRRIFLRPGSILENEQETLARQRKRLEAYMRRQGFFGTTVRMGTERVGGAEPNEGVRLRAEVRPGRTVSLRRLKVQGRNPIPTTELVGFLEHNQLLWFLPAPFQPERFEEDLRAIAAYLQTQGYPEARVTADWDVDLAAGAVDVTLILDPGPHLEMRVQGNVAIDTATLLSKTTFVESGVVDAVAIDESVAAMRALYQEAGYYEASVEAEVDEPGEDTLRITFVVDEGRRGRVVETVFRGNATYTESEIVAGLEEFITTPSLLFPTRWVEAWVQADVRAIEAFYEARGYAATKVHASYERLDAEETERREGTMALELILPWMRWNDRLELQVPDDRLRAVFEIEEGPRRKVASMTMEGLPPEIPQGELLRRLKLKAGEPYVHRYLAMDRRELLTTLAAYGYPRAYVYRDLDKPKPSVGGLVRIHYRIDPGPKARFGGVLVRGNFRTEASLIEEQLRLEPGDPLDLVALGQARRRLRALGPFSRVDLTPLDLWRDEEEVWLLVALQERDTRTADAVITASTDDGLSLGVEYRDRNLLGRAIRLDTRLHLGQVFGTLHPALRIGFADSADATLSAPRPFGVPFDIEGRMFYRFRKTKALTDGRLGAVLGVSRQLLPRTVCDACPDLSSSLRFALNASEFDDRTRRFAAFERGFTGGQANVGRFIASLSADRRDSFVDPRSGYAASLRLELAHDALVPGRGHTFWRAVLDAESYTLLGVPFERPLEEGRKLGGPLVLALAATYGASRPWGDSIYIPASESFFYGGDFSLRGMDLKGVGPGEYLLLGHAELRWYLLQNIGIGTLQLAAFADLGTLADNPEGLFAETTVTTGPILRYVTPVGPLALTWAYPVLRPPSLASGEPPLPRLGKIHVTFGYSF